VADVSGHGVKAGTLMAMVKSATRMRLRSGGDLSALFNDLNSVLFPLKNPSMYVTCAAVQLDGNGGGQFALAGHLPILHYRKSAGRVERLTEGGPPLAMLEASAFPTGKVRLEPGDVLAFLTDGLVEVEDGGQREFGIERIEGLLSERAAHPLPAVFAAILSAVRAHGPQRDDQTLLLVRAEA
jgi:serine phosphatase RsbU (regulator of sigma subunit)